MFYQSQGFPNEKSQKCSKKARIPKSGFKKDNLICGILDLSGYFRYRNQTNYLIQYFSKMNIQIQS